MGYKQFIVVFSFLIPIIVSCQNYPRFELYQLKQGTDSGQFIVTGLDSNLAFNNILKFRSADSTLLIGLDTVAVKSDITLNLLGLIDAGLGIEVNEVDGQIFIESLSIEDSIYNGTASLIAKGTPLYATGVQGNYWSVAPADASDPSKMPVVVIAGEDIVSGAIGLGLIKGHIKQVNTTGLADGAEVYVASGGGYTSTKPTAEGVIIQRLGTVIKGNSANGSGIINLGDEAYWSDYTSLTKLRDTLVIFRDSVTNQIRDSLVFYVDRVELNDTLLNYVNRVELNDSLILYPNRVELGDSLLLYPNRVELGDSLALFLKTEVDGSVTNELQTLSKLGLDITLSNNGGTVRDSILTEAQVDNYVSNNGYLTSEVDGSVTNELQTISKVDRTVTLSNSGGSFVDSILTESQVDAYVNNNGYLTTEVDGSTTNEIQTLSKVGQTVSLSLSGGSFTDDVLSESEVDAFVSNNGYLTAEVDGSVTNEIQDISTTGAAGNISISDGSTLTLNVDDADASATNEIQTLSYNTSTDVISISGGNSIDITEVNQNETITLSGDVSGSGTTAITTTVADDSHNHVISNVDNLQTSLNSKQDNLSGTGIVKSTSGTISYITDNSSNWDAAFNDRIYTAAFSTTAGTNIKTLTLTQQDAGTVVASFVDETGELWSEGSETNEIYYSGKIGVGLTNPDYPMHVSGRGYFTDDLLVYDRIYIGSDFNHLSGSHAPYIDRYSAIGETGMDFFAYNSGVNGPLFRFFDSYNAFQEVFILNTASSTYQIIGYGDSDFNGDFNIDGRLDVNGDINFTGDLYDNGSLVSFTGTTINNNADNRIITGSNTANTLNGETGLTWDGDSLQVSGDMRVNNEATFTLYNTYNLSSLAGQIELENDNGKVYLDYNGNFTITTLGGSGVIDIGANNVGVLEPYTSDTTLKTNIVPNQYGLKKVMDIETIKFNWKDKKSKGSQKEVGFNAQNLKKVIPEATYRIPSNGKLGIKDDAIIATLTKAIQEQQLTIELQDKRIQQLEEMVKQLINNKQ